MYPDDYPTLIKKAKEECRKLGSMFEKILELTLPITSLFQGRFMLIKYKIFQIKFII